MRGSGLKRAEMTEEGADYILMVLTFDYSVCG